MQYCIAWFPSCRKQKEIMKLLETPEEKRQRRLAKKESKAMKKREKEGWDEDYLVSCMHFWCGRREYNFNLP